MTDGVDIYSDMVNNGENNIDHSQPHSYSLTSKSVLQVLRHCETLNININSINVFNISH